MFAHHHHPAAVVLASGEDSLAYLQSQWSSQLDWKGENQATYGLRLNRKGRILADGFILRKDKENFLIISYDCPPANLIALLEENVVADDVEFEDRTDGHEIISLWGGDHEAISSQFAFELPQGNSFATTEIGLIFWGRKTKPPNIDILADEEHVEALGEFVETVTRADALAMVDANSLALARVASGMPAIPVEMGPTELPQECGLEDDAVDFDKGCYLGQEVMARIHAMGQVQRVLLPATIKEESPETSPADLFLGEKKAGELKSYFSHESEISGSGMALVRRNLLPEIRASGLSFLPSEEPQIFIK
jgi:tRNA-modifying protein YgfZ